MADLRLPRLPDRTPVKISIQVTPHLFADLTRYGALYKEAYGQEEAVALSGQSAPCLTLH